MNSIENEYIPYSERVKNMWIDLVIKNWSLNLPTALPRVPSVGKDLILSGNSSLRCLSLVTSIMVSLTPENLHDILAFVVEVARKAGDLILEGSTAIQSSESGVGEKKNSVDLVTEYDVRVEELVKTELEIKYPTFGL